MVDPELTEKFFIESGSEQLHKILLWARARRVAPWALFFAVLLRVAAATSPRVRLPALIGERASLNVFAAFVARSGGGKGTSEKVAKMAWPAAIAIHQPGSGEGIAELFMVRGKDGDDNERIESAILSASEIDVLTGLASRQGSILLAQLKSAWMGESLGQSNASKATSRYVAEHDYRLCLSVGCQFGHGGVIFGDTTGGTPQRFLWAPTEDPDMPYGGGPDPDPLDTSPPPWQSDAHGVSEISYGIPEIEEAVIGEHLARQRGQEHALDGHAMLSRCKVAALLAIMHQRQEVNASDWALSEIVMTVSNLTRASMLEYDRQAARARIRDRAAVRAAGEEFYESSRLESVKRSLVGMLKRDGEQSGSDLRRRLGTSAKRAMFEPAMDSLMAENLVTKARGQQNGSRYKLSGHGDQGGHPQYLQVTDSDQVGHGDRPTATDLESRSSNDSNHSKVSCAKWFERYIDDLRAAGHTTVESSDVLNAGEAAGYTRNNVAVNANKHGNICVIGRKGNCTTWAITDTQI